MYHITRFKLINWIFLYIFVSTNRIFGVACWCFATATNLSLITTKQTNFCPNVNTETNGIIVTSHAILIYRKCGVFFSLPHFENNYVIFVCAIHIPFSYIYHVCICVSSWHRYTGPEAFEEALWR